MTHSPTLCGTTRLTNFSTSTTTSSFFLDHSVLMLVLSEPIESLTRCPLPFNCAAASTTPFQSPLTTILSNTLARLAKSLYNNTTNDTPTANSWKR